MRLFLLILLLATPGCAAINSTVEWYRGLPVKPTSVSFSSHPSDQEWEVSVTFEVRLDKFRPSLTLPNLEAADEFDRAYRENRPFYEYLERQR